jgi:two-component sensor histidine kinase
VNEQRHLTAILRGSKAAQAELDAARAQLFTARAAVETEALSAEIQHRTPNVVKLIAALSEAETRFRKAKETACLMEEFASDERRAQQFRSAIELRGRRG